MTGQVAGPGVVVVVFLLVGALWAVREVIMIVREVFRGG